MNDMGVHHNIYRDHMDIVSSALVPFLGRLHLSYVTWIYIHTWVAQASLLYGKKILKGCLAMSSLSHSVIISIVE
jgi:hypothetical protein